MKLDKLNLLFDNYLIQNNKSFISLRQANHLIKNSNDKDLLNIDLKKLLESGILSNSIQTETTPKQWRIFLSKNVDAAKTFNDAQELLPVKTKMQKPSGFHVKEKSTALTSDGKDYYEYDKIAIIALIVVGSLIGLYYLLPESDNDSQDFKVEKYASNSETVPDKSNNVDSQITAEEVLLILYETKFLYEELMSFKDNEDFHYYGFDVNYKYNSWLKRADELSDLRQAKYILLNYGFALGDLQMLGLEYVKTKGRESKYSNWSRNRIENALTQIK